MFDSRKEERFQRIRTAEVEARKGGDAAEKNTVKRESPGEEI